MDIRERFLQSALLAPDERPLLSAVLRSPEDDAVRLVYADWLEEHGGTEGTARADFLRVGAKRKTSKVGALCWRTNRSCAAMCSRSGWH